MYHCERRKTTAPSEHEGIDWVHPEHLFEYLHQLLEGAIREHSHANETIWTYGYEYRICKMNWKSRVFNKLWKNMLKFVLLK